jgi:hypothetical protein
MAAAAKAAAATAAQRWRSIISRHIGDIDNFINAIFSCNA